MRSLKGHLKSLYSFIICDCDGAGIWNFDLEAAEMYIGFAVTKEEFEEAFVKTQKAVSLGGGKFFFPDFIEHQYPSGLQANNKAHKNFISVLTKYGLIDSNQQIIKKEAPLEEPLEGSHVQSRSSNGLGNGPVGAGVGEEALLAPRMVSAFKKTYPDYPEDRDSDYPACVQIAFKIAKSNGWMKEAVTNGKLDETVEFWTGIVEFSKTDNWFSTRSISDFNKEYQRLIQKKTNGTSTHKQRGHSVGKTLDRDTL